MQHISCVSYLTSIVLYIYVQLQIKGGAQRPGSPLFLLKKKKKEKMQKEEKPVGQGILLKFPLPPPLSSRSGPTTDIK